LTDERLTYYKSLGEISQIFKIWRLRSFVIPTIYIYIYTVEFRLSELIEDRADLDNQTFG